MHNQKLAGLHPGAFVNGHSLAILHLTTDSVTP